MSLLLETIRVAGGSLQHLRWHQDRVNRSRMEVLGCPDPLPLEESIQVPELFANGIFRCRVLYSQAITSVAFEPYVTRQLTSLALADGKRVTYTHKFADRRALSALVSGAGTDDVIIVKDGLITDASYANLAFRRGEEWYTPARPLLQGTCRARLIAEGRIRELDIPVGVLAEFTAVKLINAMLGFSESPEYPVSIIKGV